MVISGQGHRSMLCSAMPHVLFFGRPPFFPFDPGVSVSIRGSYSCIPFTYIPVHSRFNKLTQ